MVNAGKRALSSSGRASPTTAAASVLEKLLVSAMTRHLPAAARPGVRVRVGGVGRRWTAAGDRAGVVRSTRVGQVVRDHAAKGSTDRTSTSSGGEGIGRSSARQGRRPWRGRECISGGARCGAGGTRKDVPRMRRMASTTAASSAALSRIMRPNS